MGESITEGTIATVLKKPGDYVQNDDVIAQIETDKVTIDVKYTEAEGGTIKELLIAEEATVTVGQPVVVVAVGEGAPAAPVAEAPAAAEKPKKKAAPPPPPPPTPEPAPAPAAPTGRVERRVKMTRLRQRVADRLKGAQNTYAMLTTFNEVDMTGIMALRSEYKDAFFEQHGVKLGFMSAFVKASVDALKRVPAVNAVIEGDEIVYRDYYDVSIAVATPKGLVVPVLRDANVLNFAEVEKVIAAIHRLVCGVVLYGQWVHRV